MHNVCESYKTNDQNSPSQSIAPGTVPRSKHFSRILCVSKHTHSDLQGMALGSVFIALG